MLGAALALYGLVGIVLFVVIAVNVARPLERARQLSESVDEQRAALVDSLSEAETTIRQMSTSVDRMDDSLSEAKIAIDQAATISHGVASKHVRAARRDGHRNSTGRPAAGRSRAGL